MDDPAEPLPESIATEFLRILCRPPADRTEAIERLCREHPEHEEPLRLALQRHASHGPAATDEPQQIGPYRILDVLGEGGMGTVYRAEQREPVRRRVALKVIRLGMDTRQILARFELERQALAVMNHDAIAKVFDAGSTPEGRPYFVMEYVQGVPITDYCRHQKIAIEQRLRLMQRVCAGVQHAHQRGVVHRDLSPRNILVAEVDGKPSPKIIDFGLARATDHMHLQGTVFTERGLILGTPNYMSPEQANPTGLGIDGRSDVYSLGVILHELLTDRLPFVTDSERPDLFRLQQLIREQDPARPSTTLKALDKRSQSAIADGRRTTTAALYRRLRDGLDWIVLKAVDKDRGRRYGSPAALADDIERYLDDAPLVAGPPTVGLRVRRFLRRRGRTVALATAVLAAAVAVTLWQLEARTAARYQVAVDAALQAWSEITAQRPDRQASAATDATRFVQWPDLDADALAAAIGTEQGHRQLAALLDAFRNLERGGDRAGQLLSPRAAIRSGRPVFRVASDAASLEGRELHVLGVDEPIDVAIDAGAAVRIDGAWQLGWPEERPDLPRGTYAWYVSAKADRTAPVGQAARFAVLDAAVTAHVDAALSRTTTGLRGRLSRALILLHAGLADDAAAELLEPVPDRLQTARAMLRSAAQALRGDPGGVLDVTPDSTHR